MTADATCDASATGSKNVYVEYGLLVRRIDIITGTHTESLVSRIQEIPVIRRRHCPFVRLAVKQHLEMRENQPKGINPLC